MTENSDDQAPDLGAFFDAARADTPKAEAALLARVMADADHVQAEIAPYGAPGATATRVAWSARLAAMWRMLGGWPSLAGLSTAAVAGLWIGIAPPASLSPALSYLTGAADGFVIDAAPMTAFLLPEEAM